MQQSTLGVTRKELRELVKGAGNKCVSVYIPIVKTERIRREFELRAKESLKNLRALMGTSEMEEGVLAKVESALRDPDNWKTPGRTLALFVSDRMEKKFYLPDGTDTAEVHVGNEFYIRPLLRSVVDFHDVWLLAASRKQVRLFEVNGNVIRELDLPEGVPSSLEDMNRYTDTLRGTAPDQQHTGTTGGQNSVSRPQGGPTLGDRRAMHFGQNDIDDHMREILGTFMKRVKEGLHSKLVERGWPVVFSGPEELQVEFEHVFEPQYRTPIRLNVHPNELTEAQAGRLLSEELARWTHESSKHNFERVRSGVKRVTTDVKEILTAAEEGRVISLFVLGDRPLWGSELNGGFDEEMRQATRTEVEQPESHWDVHGKTRERDFDLVNLAVVRTARTGGTLRYVPVDRGPGESGALYASIA